MNDIRSFDLNLLKTLDALLDECSVTRAASRLSLTQPAVSSTLNRLRDSFNDPLFVRASHGIVPTERALALAGPIKRLLADASALLHTAEVNPAELSAEFKIAASDNDMYAVCQPFILALKQRAPHVRVALLSIHRLNVHAMLERGELDLILLDPNISPPDLHSRALYEERYVCIMREGHPAAASGVLTLDAFCSQEHILASFEGGQFSGVTDDALAKIGRSRRVSLSVTSFLLLLSVLKQSDFISVVPEHLARGVGGIVIVEPPLEVQGYTKIMAWHARNHQDPVQQWLRGLMWEVCGEKKPDAQPAESIGSST